MSRVLVNTKDMDLTTWLTWRRKGIGGTDASAICGLNKWTSSIDVYNDKLDDFPPESVDNFAMKVGRMLEQTVADLWMDETGKKCQRRNAILQHDEYDWMLANIDRWVVGENAGLEIKTGSSYVQDQWKNGAIPPQYEIQCHHYMAVTGADRWYLACLIGNTKLEMRTIERDEDTIKNLIRIEKDFWENHVEKGIMPPPDGTASADATIKATYTDVTPGLSIELNDMESSLDRYFEIDELKSQLEQEQKEIKQNIQIRMDTAELAVIGDHKVTWKEQKGRTTLDSKKLQADHPDIFEQYAKTGKPTRVFRVS